MSTLWLAWAVGLVMMLASAFFVYKLRKNVSERLNIYKEKQTEKPSRWRYLTFLDLAYDVLIGWSGRLNLITALIAFIFGALLFLTATIRIIASLVGSTCPI